MRLYWILATVFGLLFAVLFSIRLELFDKFLYTTQNDSLRTINSLSDRDSWMNIFQNNRKIGSSHTTLSKTEKGYLLTETLFMRINTMGLAQNISLKTSGRLNPDFTLSSFDFKISSGRFRFSAQGAVSGNVLSIKTHSFGSTKNIDIRIKEKLYVSAGILDAVNASGIEPGDELVFQVFDPATMGQEPVIVRVVGKEEIRIMGDMKESTKVSLIFKGAIQQAWIGKNGEVLKEKGLLGINLEKTTRDDALFGLPVESSQDLTKVASVPSNVLIEDASQLQVLEVEIWGVNYDDVYLEGGRQTLNDNILVINKESLSDLPAVYDANKMEYIGSKFLKPTPFIQSDHPKILNLVKKIVSIDDKPLVKANKLVEWIYKNIKKRPVLSLPDALATLEIGVGDCNEHAVLLAALARAAGIPVKVEAGLVYLNGRFYYHAWNLLYLGKWITADSLFGQIPADVTHIRFSSGIQIQQLDIMNIIGKIKLKIVKKTK